MVDERRRRLRSDPVRPVEIHAQWRFGPRTKAWDDLWRWLLSEPPEEAVCDDEGTEKESRKEW